MLSAMTLRELRSFLRDRRMVLLQFGLVSTFSLLIIVRWPTDGRVALSGTRSQEVFRLFAYGLLAILLLLLPVFPATSIVRERKRGTLALLLNTPLGAWRIFTGKLLAVIAFAGIVLALSLPAASACYAMGGLGLYEDVWRVYQLLMLVALQYAVLGMLVSSYSNSIDSAVRVTYGLILGLTVLTIGPHYFFQGTKGIVADFGEILRSVSPLAVIMSLTGAGNVGGHGLVTKTDLLGRFTMLSLSIAAIASIWTIGRLNHRIFDQSREAGAISDDQATSIQLFRRLFFLIDPQRRSSGIPSFVNPVMVKELRCRRFGRLHWLLRLVSVCAVLSLGLTYATTAGALDWGAETIGGIMVVMQVALIVLMAPSLSAGLLSAERESRGWQLLQSTPLPISRIIWGKLLSVVLPLMLILCATLPGYLVMVYIEPGMELQVRRVLVCLVSTTGFAMLLSAAVGSMFHRTAAATAASYGVLVAICTLPLLVWVGRDAPFGHDVVEAALCINPIAAPLSVIRMQGFQHYVLIPANWWISGIGSAISFIVLIAQTYRISRPE